MTTKSIGGETYINKSHGDLYKILPSSCSQALDDWKQYYEKKIDITEIPVWKDLHLLPNFSPSILEWNYNNLVFKSTDIVNILGLKTGTTWLREILRQILYGKDEEMLRKTRAIDYYMVYLEVGNISKWQIWDELNLPRRYLQCHLPPDAINMEMLRNCKVIYCKRNFKDQLHSFHHICRQLPNMTKNFSRYYSPDWNTFFKQHMEGIQPLGQKLGETFLDFSLQWEPYLEWKNFLTVSYEDMKEDLPREIQRIASHIEVEMSAEDIDRVVAATTIKTMKENTYPPLIRKGIVGDWKNHFTVAQSELVDDVMRKKGMKIIK